MDSFARRGRVLCKNVPSVIPVPTFFQSENPQVRERVCFHLISQDIPTDLVAGGGKFIMMSFSAVVFRPRPDSENLKKI